MAKRSMFVGMDIHKESIDISVAEDGRQGEVMRRSAIWSAPARMPGGPCRIGAGSPI